MSYKVVRDYFVARLAKQVLAENGDMEFKSDVAMNGKFILRVPETNGEGPTIIDRLHPRRQVQIQLALKLSDNKTQQADYTNMRIKIDQLIREIPNPTNFQSTGFQIRNIMFDREYETLEKDWMRFTLNFIVEDELLYA